MVPIYSIYGARLHVWYPFTVCMVPIYSTLWCPFTVTYGARLRYEIQGAHLQYENLWCPFTV